MLLSKSFYKLKTKIRLTDIIYTLPQDENFVKD